MHISYKAEATAPSGMQLIGNLAKVISRARIKDGLQPVADGTLGIPSTPVIPSALTDIKKYIAELEANPAPIQYTHWQGTPEIREALAELFAEDYKIPCTAEHMLLTAGNTSGMNAVYKVLEGPYIATVPYYPLYSDLAKEYGKDFEPLINILKTGLTANGVRNAFESLSKKQKCSITDVKGTLIINLPGNPVGTLPSKEELSKIADVLRQSPGINLVFDDVYSDVMLGKTVDGKAPEFTHLLTLAPDLADRSVVLRTFSKNGLGGERIGILVAPHEIIEPLKTAHYNLVLHAPLLGQIAAVPTYRALVQDPDTRQAISDYYAPKVAYMRGALKECGTDALGEAFTHGYIVVGDLHEMIGTPLSKEAVALLTKICKAQPEFTGQLMSTTIKSDFHIALQLLADTKNPVGVTPLSEFGTKPEDGFVRISCSADTAALKRIGEGIQSAIEKARALNNYKSTGT